ncbi:MAG: hypothetical protein H6842_12490 [Rhodospirillaceae bacterium]|nr:hypothetical protein [Rhodospirillaceae bacterium]
MHRFATILAALLLLPAAALAQSGKPPCVAGQPVEVFWGSEWWPGHVIEGPRPDSTCYITYDGYDSSWDEWVTPDRLRRVGSLPPGGLCTVGAVVQIEWNGSWYPGRVLEGPQADGTCYITYDGYDSGWDEWVAPSRLRPGQ